MQQRRPIILFGPTAGGKTDLAIDLALSLDGPVISADSMQIYRHLDAGTAKPTPVQRRQVTHHMIDVAEPFKPFSVNDWLAQVEPMLEQLSAQGKRPIIAGGTHLYLKALLEGMFDGPPADPVLRAELASLDNDQLRARLEQVDPASASRIAAADRKRTIRAIEVCRATGRSITHWQTQWSDLRHHQGVDDSQGGAAAEHHGYRYDPILIGLHWQPGDINPRINRRVKAMFFPQTVEPELAQAVCFAGESLPVEVARLDEAGLIGEQAAQAIGYKQLLDWMHRRDHKIKSLDDAYERTKILSRRLAKQQRTWFKRFVGVHWFDAAAMQPEQRLEQAIGHIRAIDARSD